MHKSFHGPWLACKHLIVLVSVLFTGLLTSNAVQGQEVVPKAALCEHTDFDQYGECEDFISSDADLRNNLIGNDRASFVHVPRDWRVALYEHINYGGRCQDFLGNSNLTNTYIGNDSVSSIRVGASCSSQLPATEQAWCAGEPDARDLGSNKPLDPGFVVEVHLQVYPGDDARFYFNYEDVNGSYLGQDILTLTSDRIPGIWRYGLSSRWAWGKSWQDDWRWRVEFRCPG